MLQGCRLLKRCPNLPARHCVAEVKAVKAVSEPTCWALFCRGAGCLSGVRTYLQGTVCRGAGCLRGVGTNLPGTVLQGCRLLMQSQKYLPGTVLQGCRLLMQSKNLPDWHCAAGMQAV